MTDTRCSATPNTLFRTLRLDQIPAAERFDYWREVVTRHADAELLSAEQYPVFDGTSTYLETPDGVIERGRANPYLLRRLPRHIRRDGRDYLGIGLNYSGTGWIRHDKDSDISAAPGEFYCADLSRVAEIASLTPYYSTELVLPRPMLHAALGAIPAPSRISAALRASRLTPLLKAQLDLVPNLLADMSEAERAHALSATEVLAIAVVKNALQMKPGTDHLLDAADPTQAHALYLAACRFIDSHLNHPELGAAMLMHALQCSRTHLYRAFALHQQSVSRYIKQTRLTRLWRLLESARGHPISELAARCGLYDAPHINRMFKAEFSITPSQVRRQDRKR
ncbi:MAG: helix-turn-helix domain-containing protein [Pseudomonadales bacterium]|jgi:AraC-like DNA-binding protein|nr:helix-turn-helix domain-containing protein [Pseudomonadales bacterium]